MIKLGTVFWLVLVAVLGFATFKIKYGVQDLEDALLRVQKQTVSEQQEIRVLNAEWTYLTQPDRLEELNQRFLALSPIAPTQLLHTIAELPFRPPPVPADGAPTDAAINPSVALAANVQPQPQTQPDPEAAGSGLPILPAVFARPALAIETAAAPAPKPISLRPPKSLDALFAQIAERR